MFVAKVHCVQNFSYLSDVNSQKIAINLLGSRMFFKYCMKTLPVENLEIMQGTIILVRFLGFLLKLYTPKKIII